MKYNMRIAKRKDKNGCFTFTQRSIDNIPEIDIFADSRINKIITDGCKEVLRRSMDINNPYRYGEQGLLISTVDVDSKGNKLPHIHECFDGEYHNLIAGSKYGNIVAQRPIKDLIFIHNHPNNSSFSAEDLKSLTNVKSIIAIIAVGNRHNVFILINNTKSSIVPNYIDKHMMEYQKKNGIVISRKKRKAIADSAARYILDNYAKFKLDYYKLRRKSK